MDTLSIKLIAAVIVFAAGLVGGLLPVLSQDSARSKTIFYYGEYFARGIFLSAALIHLLPDAQTTFAHIYPNIAYPITFAICALTVFVIRLIEQYTSQYATQQSYQLHWIPYLLLILLSIHSIITGAALGISNSIGHIVIIFLAIISHKSAAAFALGVNMRNHNIRKKIMLGLLITFSLMTPVGIIASSVISAVISSDHATIAQGIFGAIAAGTFLYIAAFKSNLHDTREKTNSSILPTLYFGAGIVLMAVVAFWI